MPVDLEELLAHIGDAQRCMYEIHQPVSNTTVRGLLHAIRELHGEHVRVGGLIERARAVSPSDRMAVYVTDLEKAVTNV